jgi:Flp pilus assembly protein TadG
MRASARRFLRDTKGVIAIEFAVFAVVFIILMGAIVDFGGLAFTRFRMENAVSAASNYALVNGESINATGAATLAAAIGSIIASADSGISGKVVVNNGPEATISGGNATVAGSASPAASCYCPSNNGSSINWGGAVTCDEPCPSGGLAGKFVTIDVKRTYTPLFLFLDEAREIAVSATVQAK